MSIYFDSGYEPGTYASGSEKGGAAVPKMGYGGDPTRFGPGANDWTWAFGSPSDFAKKSASGRGGSFGGSIGKSTSGTQTSTSTTEFTMPRPQQPDMPTLEFAKVDKRAVAALAQKAAAPGIRTLRESVQQAMGGSYENPNVRRMTLREALQGYGAGLERVMSGAQAQGRQEHQQDLNILNQERGMNYQTQVQAAMDRYNKAWSEYLASAKKVTTTTSESSIGEGGGGEWRRGPGMGLYFVPKGSTWKPVSPA